MSEGTAYSDEDLVRRFLAKLCPTNPMVRYTRQRAIERVFALDPDAARQVCRRHGFDPDEKVRAP